MIFRAYIGISCTHLVINKLLSCFRFSFLVVMISLVAACSSGGGDGEKTITYYLDSDGDGYGDPASTQSAASQPAGYVTNKTDCDDSSAAINPDATEVIDGVDNNCNGQVDEVFITYYQDADADSYGNPAITQSATSQPAGYVLDNTDCDDGFATVNPDATEISDGIDNNCDGQVDEGFINYYQDSDGDGHGNPAVTQIATSPPAGYVSNSTDCDDSDAAVHPGATEVGDGIDNNCDGQVDEGFITYYRDADSDGYGDPTNTQVANSQPAGYVSNNTDCDDSDAAVHPDATEVTDGIDNNCDGQIDNNAVLNPPTSVQATAGDASVSLTWLAISGATGYTIYWDTTAGVTTSDGSVDVGVASTYDFGGLTNGTTYYYRVAARNSVGEGALSLEVSATPKAPGSAPVFNFYDVDDGLNPEHSAAVWTGTRWVMVGGGVITSTDGIHWQVVNTTVGAKGIVRIGTRLVAVGDYVYTSDDEGKSWTQRTANKQSLEAVAWTGATLVATDIGGFSTTRGVYTSTDGGVTWNKEAGSPGERLYDIVWTGSELIVVNDGNTRVSTDEGATWSDQRPGGETNIVWNGTQFLSGTSVSSDGATWSSGGVGIPINTFKGSPVWDGTQWIWPIVNSAAFPAIDSTVYTSSDGVNWTQAAVALTTANSSLLPNIAWSGSQAILFGSAGIASSTDITNWSHHKIDIDLNRSISLAGSSVLMTGSMSEGQKVILKSTDGGLSWERKENTVPSDIVDITFGGSQYVAVGSSGNILTSPDAEVWTTRSTGNTDKFNQVVWSGSRFVVVGDNGTLFTSTDGATWVDRSSAIATTSEITGIVWTGNQFVAVTLNGVVLTSNDGITWAEAGINAFIPGDRIYAITWTGSNLVTVGKIGTGTGGVYISSDAISWTRHETGFTATTSPSRAVVWTGTYLATPTGSSLYTSNDGVTWVAHSLPNTTYNFTDIAWTGDRLIMITVNGQAIMAEE